MESNDNGLYTGQGLSVGQASHGQMQVQQLKDGASAPIQEAAASNTKAWQGFYASMHKMGEQLGVNKAKVQRNGIVDEYETKWKLGFKVPPGTKSSWLMADGSVDTEKINTFAEEYMGKLRDVKPAYAGLTTSQLWDADNEEFIMNARRRLEGQAALQSVDAVRETGNQVLQALLEAHDYDGYSNEVAHQNAAGARSDVEAQLLLRKGDVARTQYLMQDGVDVIMPNGKRYSTRQDKAALGRLAIENAGRLGTPDDGLVPLEGWYEDENGEWHVLQEKKSDEKRPSPDGDEGKKHKFDEMLHL